MRKFLLSPNWIPILTTIGIVYFDRSIFDAFIGMVSFGLYQIAEVLNEIT